MKNRDFLSIYFFVTIIFVSIISLSFGQDCDVGYVPDCADDDCITAANCADGMETPVGERPEGRSIHPLPTFSPNPLKRCARRVRRGGSPRRVGVPTRINLPSQVYKLEWVIGPGFQQLGT